MPEGLTNAPAAFQRFLNDIFVDMIDVIVIIYLDDILIYSDNISEHKLHVWEVLHRLCANGLFACADKCGFHVTSCKYLRYMLSPEGLTMALYKVQIIQDWPVPRKVKDIQSFLNFANFYHRFIYGYSEITVPLTHLTRKGTPGISPMSAIQHLKHLKRLSPQLWSLPIGSWTLKSQSRLMPLTMHLPLSSPLRLPMATCTLLHSTSRHFQPQNSIMMSMTKSYSQFLKLSNDGDITSKALDFQLMWSPITGICNTFQ